jgi:hypothetical protein
MANAKIEALKAVRASEGWKLICEKIDEKVLEATNRLVNASTFEFVRETQGIIKSLNGSKIIIDELINEYTLLDKDSSNS